jgi:hypothetical protein
MKHDCHLQDRDIRATSSLQHMLIRVAGAEVICTKGGRLSSVSMPLSHEIGVQ